MQHKKMFEAIEFATKAHAGQFRKATRVPYIIHPLSVAQILIEHNCDETLVIAGILHDTVEDTPITLPDIAKQFGQPIADLVESLSEPDRSDTWENRKQHTIDYLKNVPTEVLLVACADKLHNIRSIRKDYVRQGEKVWTRFNRPKSSQQWYYQALADLFTARIEDEVSQSLFTAFQTEVNKVFGPRLEG